MFSARIGSPVLVSLPAVMFTEIMLVPEPLQCSVQLAHFVSLALMSPRVILTSGDTRSINVLLNDMATLTPVAFASPVLVTVTFTVKFWQILKSAPSVGEVILATRCGFVC